MGDQFIKKRGVGVNRANISELRIVRFFWDFVWVSDWRSVMWCVRRTCWILGSEKMFRGLDHTTSSRDYSIYLFTFILFEKPNGVIQPLKPLEVIYDHWSSSDTRYQARFGPSDRQRRTFSIQYADTQSCWYIQMTFLLLACREVLINSFLFSCRWSVFCVPMHRTHWFVLTDDSDLLFKDEEQHKCRVQATLVQD